MAVAPAVQSGGWSSNFVRARTLAEYPRGARRWALLLLTVLSSILAGFEFQLAPVLPLLLPYLHMSQVFFGFFVTFTVLITGVSAVAGGPLADRYGRVVLIDAGLAIVTLMVFANVLVTNVASFLIVRTAMGIAAGVMAGAGAGLIRDMSPRVDRALGFGLFTIGPVAANFMANAIAGKTLPIFHTWQSQFWIMGCLGVLMCVPILIWLSDLSPELRVQVWKDELAAQEAAGRRRPVASELPSSTRDAYARLMRHPELLLLIFGMAANLTLYLALSQFGPLMFTQAFHFSPADAARVVRNFWFANLSVLIITGWVSDRLQIRKGIAVFGGVLSLALMIYWVPWFGGHAVTERALSLFATAMGCFLAIAYVPWAAQFSETLEEVSPALQATGWASFNLVLRVWVAVSAPLSLVIAGRRGWGTWVEVCCVGMAIYVVAMIFTRGRFYHIAETLERDSQRADTEAGRSVSVAD